jgi:hypothetical protein
LRLLFFPFTQERDHFKILMLKNLGHQVFCAASKEVYGEEFYLPHITSKDFESEIIKLLDLHKIDFIYSENVVVREKLIEARNKNFLNIDINQNDEFSLNNLVLQEVLKISKDVFYRLQKDRYLDLEIDLEEIIYLANDFYRVQGQCSFEKFVYLYLLAKSTTSGCIIEIGVLFGKSLKSMALGSANNLNVLLFGIDPWNHEESIQRDEPGPLATNKYNFNWESILQMAKINLYSFISANKLILLRSQSKNSVSVVKEYLDINKPSDPFISILHIDGNHDYKSCLEDWNSWKNSLRNNSWVIIDDYNWPYGSGPFKLGNLILDERSLDVKKHFVIDNSLFINFR